MLTDFHILEIPERDRISRLGQIRLTNDSSFFASGFTRQPQFEYFTALKKNHNKRATNTVIDVGCLIMLLSISDNIFALKKKCWDDQTERSKGVLEGIVAAHLGFGVCGIALLSWGVTKGYVS